MNKISKDQLSEILRKHRLWLSGEDGGERANLSYCDLRWANLYGANLSDCDLSECDLSGADLYGADLSGASLSGSKLSHNRYLIGCTLTNYQMVAFMHKGELRITAGCRRGLTIEQAKERWSPGNEVIWSEETPEYGQRQLRMLEFLIAEAQALGWLETIKGDET